jgi:two-component system response regulator (stage 0 sporulation protein F)
MSLEPDFTIVAGAERGLRGILPTPLKVFVADDDEPMREAVAESLRAVGHLVVEARDGAELLELLRGAADSPLLRPDVIVADLRMPKVSGLGVMAALQRGRCHVPVLVITGLAGERVQTVARQMGATAVLQKPFEADDLLSAVQNAAAIRPTPR